MKKLILGLLASSAIAGAAAAADLPQRTYAPGPVAFVPAFSWTGFYAGIKGGYGWNSTSYHFQVTNLSSGHNGNGWLLGGRVGYNYQFPNNLVIGIEGEANWTDIKGSVLCVNPAFRCGHRLDWLGSISGRLGYGFDRFLVYVSGGVAFTHAKYRSVSVPGGVLFGTGYGADFTGWTVGAGLEYAVTNNIIIDAGYKYYDFGRKRAPAGALAVNATDVRPRTHTVQVGLTYKF